MLLLLVLLLLSGCTAGSSSGTGTVTETVRSEGYYRIMTMNQASTKLCAWDYQTDTKETAVLVSELLREMKAVPPVLDQKCAIPDYVNVYQIEANPPVLSLYFEDAYRDMSLTDEILCRAAVVRTLTQIPEIDALQFYVGTEHPEELLDAGGESVGLMRASDFIEHMTDGEKAQPLEAVLYFVNDTGEVLVPEERTIQVSSVKSGERAVLEQLLAGPQEEGHLPTLPSGAEILSLTTKDGICYVSFDRSFLTESLDLPPALIIYSLVDTLTALPAVEQVQIALEGDSSIVFRETIPLENPLSANMDVVADP